MIFDGLVFSEADPIPQSRLLPFIGHLKQLGYNHPGGFPCSLNFWPVSEKDPAFIPAPGFSDRCFGAENFKI